MFLIFKDFNIKSKIINKLSTYTLSVYIIHENSLIVSSIYKDIFKTPEFYNNIYMVVHLFVTIIMIYIACILIDIIRNFIFKYTVEKVLNFKIFNKKITV